MRTIIQLPALPDPKILISVGDTIGADTIIADYGNDGAEKIIPLSQLLHVKPEKILSHLKKRVGDRIEQGDVLAQKKSLLSSSTVRSPHPGKISHVDLKKGTVHIATTDTTGNQKKFYSPISGKVVHISNESVEVELKGHTYKIFEAQGDDIIASLTHLATHTIDMFDIQTGLSERAVMARHITEEAAAKLDALGAAAIISLKPPKTEMSWLVVEDSVFSDLAKHDGKKVWLRPIQKEIVVLE